MSHVDVMLKLASWNARGLSLKKNEFLIIVNKFDIFSLVETWTHKDSPIEIPGFCNFHIPDLTELSFITKITYKKVYP